MAHELQPLMHLVEKGRDQGARATELFLEEVSGLEAEVVRGRPQKRVIGWRRLRVRAWLDGRFADAEGSPEEGPALLERALTAAAAGQEDPLTTPPGRLPMVSRGLGIDDRRFPTLSEGDRLDVIVAAERGARGADRRVQTRDFRYHDRRTRRAYIGSSDTIVEERSTTYHAEGRVDVDANGSSLSIGDFVSGRSFASISSLPFGAVLARRAVALLGEPIVLDGPTRVMIPPRVAAPLFARLAEAFRHDRITSGRSLFADHLGSGRPIMDGRIHLIDDPQLPGGLRTYAFDEDGIPPVPLVLLREGAVEGRYLDLVPARRIDARPTGHAFGGTLRPSNLLLRSGTRSMSALLSEHSAVPTLVLDHVQDWDGLDLATGDLEARGAGFLQRGNVVEGPVRGVLLKGNLLDLLGRVVEIASDTDRIGHVDAPGLLVDGVTVSCP